MTSRESNDSYHSLQDAAYTFLGEMLLERDTRQYMKEAEDSGADTELMTSFFRMYDAENLKKIERFCRRKQKTQVKQLFFRSLQIAAVIIIVLFLAGGVAIATNQTIRVQLMKMLLHVEKEYTEIQLVEDETTSFDVPSDWQGTCFPSYIPDNMQIVQLLSDVNHIMYRGIDDKSLKIIFSEHGSNTGVALDTENASVQPITVHGYDGHIAVKDNRFAIFWTDGINYYILRTWNLGEDVTIRIADSVKPIP